MNRQVECGFGDLPEQYQGELRFSPSKIKDAMESLKLYKWRTDRKMKTTAAMELGTLLHMAILEPEKFAQIYVRPKRKEDFKDRIILDIADDFKNFLKENGLKVTGKKEELVQRVLEFANSPEYTGQAPIIWDIVNSVTEKQILMTEKECEQVDETLKEINSQRFTRELIRVGEREKKMWFREPETGRIITMRVDFYSSGIFGTDIPVVVDVKKVPNVRPKKMGWWLSDTKTAVQMALNRDCVKYITGVEPRCMILALDAKEPYNVVPYTLGQRTLAKAEYQYKQTLIKMMDAHESGKFTGISDGTPLSLELPHYELEMSDGFNEDEPITA